MELNPLAKEKIDFLLPTDFYRILAIICIHLKSVLIIITQNYKGMFAQVYNRVPLRQNWNVRPDKSRFSVKLIFVIFGNHTFVVWSLNLSNRSLNVKRPSFVSSVGVSERITQSGCKRRPAAFKVICNVRARFYWSRMKHLAHRISAFYYTRFHLTEANRPSASERLSTKQCKYVFNSVRIQVMITSHPIHSTNTSACLSTPSTGRLPSPIYM